MLVEVASDVSVKLGPLSVSPSLLHRPLFHVIAHVCHKVSCKISFCFVGLCFYCIWGVCCNECPGPTTDRIIE